MNALKCTCDPDGRLLRLPVEQIHEFQGDLKELRAEQYEKLKQSMQDFGFSFPEFVWRHPDGRWLTIDGHQRLRVLRREGWAVEGGVPCVQIEAKDEQEAAKKLLLAVSAYGKIDMAGLDAFLRGHELSLSEWTMPELPDLDVGFFLGSYGAGDPSAPAEFGVPDEKIEHRCPKCGYEWR